jgi:hypothetical protein
MSFFKIESDPNAATPRFGGVDAQIVIANSEAEAIALAEAQRDGDGNAVWAEATATELEAGPLTGWVFAVAVSGAVASVSVTGDSNDTLADIAGKLVTALNATALNGASYNSTTRVLIVALGSGGDDKGDKTVTVTITPPVGLFPTAFVWDQSTLVDSITDGGISTDNLEVAFDTAFEPPTRLMGYKQ